jgi:hypothetical protein
MTSEAPLRSGLHPSLVLSAYVEPLVRGRRVAVLGDATSGLADELGQRGARLVHVYDPDAARTAEALARAAPGRPHQVSYAVLAGDLGVRDGAFDAILVPDLSLFTDPADVMRRVRRLCAASGVAIFVTPNNGVQGRRLLPGGTGGEAAGRAAGALGYYELFDLVSLQFAKVRMVGQAPFVGYTVADFAPGGEPEVSVDTSLLAASEEPEHFIAVASDRAVALEAYTVVELPWADVAEAIGAAEASASVRSGERLALTEAQARAALMSAELDKMREREAEHDREAEARDLALTSASARVAELTAELGGREARLRDAEARAGDNHVRAERLVGQIRDLEEELVRQRDRATRLSKQLDDEKRARQKAELELGMLRGKPEIAGAKDRIDALSADLEAARTRIAELELETQALTTPRRAGPPEPPPQDPKLLLRVAELEQAVNAALAEASAAAAQRDTALDRAKRLEALVERGTAIEAQLATEQRERAALAAQAGALDTRASEAEQQLAAELARTAEVEERLGEAVKHQGLAASRAGSAERQLSGAEHRLAEQGRRLAEAEKLAAEREPRIDMQAHRIAALEREIEAERARAAAALASQGATDEAIAELARLEAALYDRGRVVAALTRDLRESERVGRELLGELLSLRSPNGAGPSGGGPDELRARLDTLAESAARSEADLQAAAWKIAQLERELSEARHGGPEPANVQIELEQALAAARDEVASLRRALGAES